MSAYDKGPQTETRIHVRTPYRIPSVVPIEAALYTAIQTRHHHPGEVTTMTNYPGDRDDLDSVVTPLLWQREHDAYLAAMDEEPAAECDCLTPPTEQDAHGDLHNTDCPLYRNPDEE